MGSNKPIVSLFIVQFFAIFSLSIYGTYVGIHLDRLTASAFIIGTVFAVRNFIQIFLRVPFSEISQIVGRKPLIVLGILFYNIAMASLYLATDWKLVFVSSILIGIAMSMHWPAVFSYIGDIAGDEYGRYSGIIFQGQDIGIILSSLTATYLLSEGIITLTGLFAITFILGMVGMVISIFILPEVLEEEHRRYTDSIIRSLLQSFRNMAKSLRILSKKFPLGMVYLIELLVTFTEFFFTSFFPLLVVLTLGYKDEDVAKVVLFSTAALIFFKPSIGKIFDKFGFRIPIMISLTVIGILFRFLTLVETFTELVIVHIIITAGLYICYISATGGVNNSSHPKDRALGMGVLGIYISVGRSLSSVILAPVLGYFEENFGGRANGLDLLFNFTSWVTLGFVVLLYILTTIWMKKKSSNINETDKIIIEGAVE